MTRFSPSSLRTRLILLVVLATVPALGLMLWNAAEQRRAAALEAEASALRLAQIASSNQERVIEVARELLSAVAQLPLVRKRDSQGCSALFANLLKQYRGYANLVAVEPSGKVFCSGQPLPGPVNFADRNWFRRVVESRDLATSEYTIGRITGRAIVVLGYPAINTSGQVEAVLAIALDLAWLNELAAKTRLPAASTLTVIDRKGTILVRFPDSEKWVGKSIAQTVLFQTILSRSEGTAEAFGMDGIARLYGFSQLGSGGEAHVAVGIAKDVAFSTANFILARNLAALVVVTVLAILAAWFGSDLFVLRRVNALSAASKRLAAGDLTARAGPMRGQDEFSQLARTFDEMADSMERMISDQDRSKEALKAGYEKLQTLKEINESILSSLDLKAILEGILEKTVTLGLFDIGVIRLIDSSGEFLEPAASRGYRDPENVHGKPTDPADMRTGKVLVQVITEKEAYPIEDLSTVDGMKAFKREGVQSAVVVPVRIENQVLGMIQLGSRIRRKFSSDEIDFLEALGIQMGIAVQNARLFSGTKQNLERIRALSEINLAITSTLDLRRALDFLLEKSDLMLPYATATVRLFDRQSGVLEAVACRNLDEEEWKSEKWLSGRGPTNLVFETRAPVIIRNVRTAPYIKDQEFFRKNRLVSYVGLPLIVKDEVLGVLAFCTRDEHEFITEEMEFLTALAGQAAIAIQNAQLHEQTKRQAVELERANKMQADFTAMIAHDLRSPLMNIMGTAEVMMDGMFGSVNEEQKKWLLKILAGGRSLVDLVSDFLDVSKLEAGYVDVVKEAVDLGGLIQKGLENHLLWAQDKKISLKSSIDLSIPPVQADPRRLDQVLGNLISNAIKFTGEGGEIEVGARLVNPTRINVWVKDNGIGIAREEIGGLFEKYRQLTSGKISEHKGTGLGLVICKTIVEAHAGKIWVESEEGKGSTFYFSLPRNLQSDLPATPC